MRTSIDIVNYFKRSAKRKELRQQKKETQSLSYQISNLKYALKRQEDWHTLYSELIERLQNVPKYRALKDPEKIHEPRLLKCFATFEMAICTPSENYVLQQRHAENMYYVQCIIEDYVVEDLLHFRIKTAEGVYAYQYSKQGIAIQPFKMILKEVTWLLTRAWYDRLHSKKG